MLLKIGDRAPQFNLQNQDGENISLENLKGEYFILWLYNESLFIFFCDHKEG